jgi:hypothetical protein
LHGTWLALDVTGFLENRTLLYATWEVATSAVHGMSRGLMESGMLGLSETFGAGSVVQPRAGSVKTGALVAIILAALILVIAASVLIWLCMRRNNGRAATDSSDLEMAYEVAPNAEDVDFRLSEAKTEALESRVTVDPESGSDGPGDDSTFGSSSEEAAIGLAVE